MAMGITEWSGKKPEEMHEECSRCGELSTGPGI